MKGKERIIHAYLEHLNFILFDMRISLFFVIFILTQNILSQNFFYKDVDFLRSYNLDSIKLTNKNYDNFTREMLGFQVLFLRNYNIHDNKFHGIESLSLPKNAQSLGKFFWYINRGDYYFYKFPKKNSKAKQEYIYALELAQSIENTQLICEALKKILNMSRHGFLQGNTTYKYFTDLYASYSYDELENITLKYYLSHLDFQYINTQKWDNDKEKKLLDFAKISSHFHLNAKIYQLVSSYYHIKGEDDKALNYANKGIENINKIKYSYKTTLNSILRISLMRYYLHNENYNALEKELSIFNSLDKNNELEKAHNRYYFFYKSELLLNKEDFCNAHRNLENYHYLDGIIKRNRDGNAIKELEAKYQSEKRGRLLANEKQRNKYLIFGGSSFALLLSSLSYLFIKNSRRKRLLALQEKELETQKNLTLLKEQEITNINAMVEGQEKERKRVAEDLHDNLGSVIATLKLHFDNLRLNRQEQKVDQETLFNRTEGLIDNAYKKVRSIAHAKNAGVIANQGLLVAVKLMAEKISSANTIQIDVIDYGLEKPIENSLEISLFRIVQELTTNIIKHAQANHATINISQDKEDITVLIEDNGIGMDAAQIDLQKGMGLHSIKTRVEHLEGSFTIDSTLTKGTTIIINIPV